MAKDALIIVDVQNDFCPGGALAVQEGDRVVTVLNRLAAKFEKAGSPVFATRDWHPERTSHFKAYGGQWPRHCVQGTPGAQFHRDLVLSENVTVVSKGTEENSDSYSGFDGADERGRRLGELLRERGVGRLFVGGLATDYCVKQTALDGVKQGFEVVLIEDAVRGVDINPGDAQRAVDEMKRAGVGVRESKDIAVSA